MTTLVLGTPAPWFVAPTPSNPTFAFSAIGGRYCLLGFLPTDPGERAVDLARLEAARDMFRQDHILLALVVADREAFAAAVDRKGLRWFLDADGEIARLYGAVDEAGERRTSWVLIDPSMRILAHAGANKLAAMIASLEALPPVGQHAGVELHAPVLVVPRILEAGLCRELIALYDRQGGERSGVMRERDGRTVPVLDSFKSRRDALIQDEGLTARLRERIRLRLIPEIRKAFQFEASRIERYIVACYDADEGGYFRPHRDNTTSGTAHRKFAVSVNLNAEAFEGGDLRFPEFGPRTYRPPTGGAVVFSCSLLHEATPVTAGRRYAFLPFLYDEAGATVREANRHLLDLSQAPEDVA